MTQSRRRQEERAFVVEGVRLVEEAQRSGWTARQVLFTDGLDERGQRRVREFSAGVVPVEQVSEAVMNATSETETPQGLLAVLEMRSLPLPKTLDFLLVLDGVRDPGNLGTILRTAAAAGVQGVLLPRAMPIAGLPRWSGGMGAISTC
jgi:TrmH family RNA methyltransferase